MSAGKGGKGGKREDETRPSGRKSTPKGSASRGPSAKRPHTSNVEHSARGERMSAAGQNLLQVISESGKALKGKKSGLSSDLLEGMYRSMVQTRLLDERMINLQRQGRIGFYVPSTGEEASQVGSALAFEAQDWIYPSYRVPGLFLQRGVPIERMVANCFGNDADLCHGRQMPVHYAFKDQNIVSISSPIGTHIVQATGTAMAQKLKGDTGVTAVMFGEGGTSSNDFHSGLNLAGVMRAPVVFICTNNQWAISVPQEKQTASESFAIKAKAYGMPGVRVDGNDVLAVYKATKDAVDHARDGKGPTLLELVTYRRGPHSSSDDPTRYRGNQADQWLDRDPILRFRKYLENQDIWSEAQESALNKELKAAINASVKVAEKAPQPALKTLFTDVFEQVPRHLREQYETLVREEGTGHEPDPDAAFPL